MSGAPRKVRVAVVGCGVFGRHHARVYHNLEREGAAVELVGIFDTQADRAQTVAQEFATQAFSSLEELKGRVECARISMQLRKSIVDLQTKRA